MEATNLHILDLSSVVFVARRNTPSLITHDFLHYNKVIPEGFEPTEAISLPVLSQLKYPTGIEITATENKTILQVSYSNRPLASPPSDQLENIAAKLLDKTGHLEYVALGINFRSYRLGNSIDGLLTLGNLPDGAIAEQVKFKVTYKQFVVHLEISLGEHKSSHERVVVSNANFSLELGSTAGRPARIDAIRTAIAHRTSCFTEFRRLIDESKL